ncbi:MAG TPA: TolC family protein [Desulfosarcina sp.]|nr:TolC family protein [Desulfosarcina sp.]
MRRCHPLLGALLVLVLSNACGLQDRYAYDAIRESYPAAPSRGRSPLPASPALPEGALSLEDAIRVAVANNPDLQMAAARIRQAEALAAKARSAYYPSVNVYTEYLRGNAPSAYLFKRLDQRAFRFDEDFNDPDVFENYESGVSARWNLYRGGRDELGRRMATTEQTISRLDRQALHNGMVESVIQTYFDVLTAEAFIGIARDAAATVDDQLRVIRLRYREGSALKSDVLSLEVRRAEAQEEEVRSRNRQQLARTALATIMGIGIGRPLELTASAAPALAVPGQFEAGLAYALTHRPDLRAVREKVRQSRMGVDRAWAGYLPSIDAFGRYYYDDEDMDYASDEDNWTAGLMFSWELFQGFATRADVHEARALFDAMLARDRKTALAVELEVKTAYLDLEEAGSRLAVARQRVLKAEESLELVSRQYKGGAATITRYLETEAARNQARLSQAAARYDREKAMAAIARAIGALPQAYPLADD